MGEINALPITAIENLFGWMLKRFGNKLLDAYPGVKAADIKQTWAVELGNYTENELRRGLDACRRLEWPPTLAEFQKLARPPIHPELAHAEAQVQMRNRDAGKPEEWSHPAIFYAAADMGRDLYAFSYQQSRARWADAIRRAEAGIEAGTLPATIPPRQLALPAPRMAPTPAEVARERCAGLRSRLPKLFQPRTDATLEGNA